MGLYKGKLNQTLIAVTLTVSGMLALTGCGNFFATKPTEIQSKVILDELSQVRESPHTSNPLPEMYRQPATRLPIKGGVKLFYFTRNHPASDLALLANQQMGVKYSVNSATNQIVVYCKDDAQADVIEKYLKMVDVEPVQVNIDCIILERFGDITMDWETSIMVQNFLGEGITLGEQLGTFFEGKSGDRIYAIKDGQSVTLSAMDDFPLVSDDMWSSMQQGTLLDLDPAFPGASLRETERSNFGMDFGYWVDQGVPGHQVRAVVDTLVSRGYLKVLLNPQLETINGEKATVTIKDYAPIEEVKTNSGGATSVYNITKYVWVSDTLTVTPHVYSDGSIGLTTDITIGSRSKPEGVVQRSIITERSIHVEENRVERGKSLIIGGMRKSEKRSVIRGVPFLKDLPLLGILFSSKDFEEKGTEIIFILTPSISSGSIENTQVAEEIRQKHAEPEYKMDLTNVIAEPFMDDAFTEVLEKEATEAELDRVQAELDLEMAQLQAETEKQRADRAATQTEKQRKLSEQMEEKAKKALQEAKKAEEEAKKIKSQSAAQKKQAQELQQQKEKAAAEAQKAQQEAEQAEEKAKKITEEGQEK